MRLAATPARRTLSGHRLLVVFILAAAPASPAAVRSFTPDTPRAARLSATTPVTPPTNPAPAIAIGNAPYIPLLRAWWADGTAAGNIGDYYENRDGGHSPFRITDFPQLTRWDNTIAPDPNDTGFGAARVVRPVVVVGNSSTAGSPPNGSSQGRRLLTSAGGLAVLHQQYRSNNLYVYPEHADHDPGAGGSGGWGDLYPGNSPYSLNSQGSSTTDLPFVRAAVACFAALRPDSKRLLAENGLLMPTFQMLLRRSATNLASPDDYFTGRAHPSALNPDAVDLTQLVTLAHDIQPDSLPPLAQLRVLQEDLPPRRPGIDLFDTNVVEQFADTPGSVMRLWRSLQRTRRMVVTAADSLDVNKRPLTFRWVVLRGDASRIAIRPLDARQSTVEIRFEWAGRRPVEPGAALESARQDVAVFASNGTWWSPPAFLTWYASDQELRSYGADGRLLDAGYVAGGVAVEIQELTPFFDWLRNNDKQPNTALVRQAAGTNLMAQLLLEEPSIRNAEARENATQGANTRAIAARNEAFTLLNQAEQDALKPGGNPNSPELLALRADYAEKTAAAAAATTAYNAARAASEAITDPARTRIATFFRRLAQDTRFAQTYAPYLHSLWSTTSTSLRNFINTSRTRLLQYGLIPVGSDFRYRSTTGSSEFTAFEANLLADFHSKLIAQIVRPDGVTVRFLSHISDRTLFTGKIWRDVYQYDPAGRLIGWRRFRPGALEEFTADGHLILNRDTLGRARQASGVTYQIARAGSSSFGSGNLEYQRNATTYTYRYSGAGDLRGRPLEDQ